MSNGITYSIGCPTRQTFDFSQSAANDVSGNAIGYSVGATNTFKNAEYTAECPAPVLWAIHNIDTETDGAAYVLSGGSGQWPYAASENSYTVPYGMFVTCQSQAAADAAAVAYAESMLDCTSELLSLNVYFENASLLIDNVEAYSVGDLPSLTQGFGWDSEGAVY